MDYIHYYLEFTNGQSLIFLEFRALIRADSFRLYGNHFLPMFCLACLVGKSGPSLVVSKWTVETIAYTTVSI